jgi:hypothetical protein
VCTARVWRAGCGYVLLGCAVVIGVAVAHLHVARQALLARALRDPGVAGSRNLVRRIDAWRARSSSAAIPGVIFGDSVFLTNERQGGFAPALGQVLAASGRAVELLDLSHVGLSAFQFYYLADRVLTGRPRFAVVEVNLRTFASDWLETPWLRFPHLAAGVPTRKVVQMRETLAAQGLGPLTPIVYRLQEKTGTLFLIDGLRRLGADSLDAVGADVNAALGLATRPDADSLARLVQRRLLLDAERAQAWYGQDFVATPTAAVLRALAADLRAAGVPTCFVVAPINRARLAKLGVSLDDLDRRLERLRVALGAQPEAWVETSAVFRPQDFVDPVHLTPKAVRRLAGLAGLSLVRLRFERPRPHELVDERRRSGEES